jgi:hypothetical protein
MSERRVIQIATAFDSGDGGGECRSSYEPATAVIALCDDGTLWHYSLRMNGQWHPLPDIPQPDEQEAALSDQSPMTEDDLIGMMRNPRYWRQRDPEFIARVTDGFRALYGATPTRPAGDGDAAEGEG